MIAQAVQMIERLFGRQSQPEAPRKRAPCNTTTSLRALTDLGESIAAGVHVIEASRRLYLCVAMEPKPEALAAQMEADRRMAAGMFQVDSSWSAAEVNKRWGKKAVLIDDDGRAVLGAMNGARGMTDAGAKEVFFEFNALDAYPERMYLSDGATRLRVR